MFGNDEVVYDDEVDNLEQAEIKDQVTGDIGLVLVLRRKFLLPQGIEES